VHERVSGAGLHIHTAILDVEVIAGGVAGGFGLSARLRDFGHGRSVRQCPLSGHSEVGLRGRQVSF
jgi:hypothetical protein